METKFAKVYVWPKTVMWDLSYSHVLPTRKYLKSEILVSCFFHYPELTFHVFAIESGFLGNIPNNFSTIIYVMRPNALFVPCKSNFCSLTPLSATGVDTASEAGQRRLKKLLKISAVKWAVNISCLELPPELEPLTLKLADFECKPRPYN